jgi:hypothetical protein
VFHVEKRTEDAYTLMQLPMVESRHTGVNQSFEHEFKDYTQHFIFLFLLSTVTYKSNKLKTRARLGLMEGSPSRKKDY